MRILKRQEMIYVNKRSATGVLVRRFIRLEWRWKFPCCIEFGLN